LDGIIAFDQRCYLERTPGAIKKHSPLFEIAGMRVRLDDAGNVIETLEHQGDFKE
jgi:hypothetical protein